MLLIKEKIARGMLVLCFLLGSNLVLGQTVVQKLQSNQQTSHFAQALAKADLTTKLNSSGPFTLFAPSNSAFDRLSPSKQANANLLLNHVFYGMATERSLKVMSTITCLSGQSVRIQTQSGNSITVDSYRIVESNIRAGNGVIHVIDGVIE